MSQKSEPVSITESRLYGLRRKRDFSNLLGLSPSDLKKLTSDENFKEWTNKKGRLIECPREPLDAVLSRLYSIIARIKTPPYLLSGKKGIKPQDNALLHCQNGYMITVDIAAFYRSTKREFVYSAFRKLFRQTDDVASLLADLVTYKGHIPTGAATSQIIAFWAYKQTFERIHKLCLSRDILMSVWVDDITFSSSKPFPKKWVSDIGQIVSEVDLSLKLEKTRKYSASEFKTSTGTAIAPDGKILVKNSKRKEILDILIGRKVENLTLKETQSLSGKLNSQRRNEPYFFSGIYARLKKHLQKLEKRKQEAA